MTDDPDVIGLARRLLQQAGSRITGRFAARDVERVCTALLAFDAKLRETGKELQQLKDDAEFNEGKVWPDHD